MFVRPFIDPVWNWDELPADALLCLSQKILQME